MYCKKKKRILIKRTKNYTMILRKNMNKNFKKMYKNYHHYQSFIIYIFFPSIFFIFIFYFIFIIVYIIICHIISLLKHYLNKLFRSFLNK